VSKLVAGADVFCSWSPGSPRVRFEHFVRLRSRILWCLYAALVIGHGLMEGLNEWLSFQGGVGFKSDPDATGAGVK